MKHNRQRSCIVSECISPRSGIKGTGLYCSQHKQIHQLEKIDDPTTSTSTSSPTHNTPNTHNNSNINATSTSTFTSPTPGPIKLRPGTTIPQCKVDSWKQCKKENESDNENEGRKIFWENFVSDETFTVRSSTYLINKHKIPALFNNNLYNTHAVDLFTTPNKINDITEHFDIKSLLDKVNNELGPELEKKFIHLPRVLIINFQIPLFVPSLTHRKLDGPGFSFIFYATINKHTLQMLLNEENNSNGSNNNNNNKNDSSDNNDKISLNALKAWDKFNKKIYNSSNNNNMNTNDQKDFDKKNKNNEGGLKVVANLINLNDLSFNWTLKKLMAQANKIPFRTKNYQQFVQGSGYLCINVDVYRFPYPVLYGANMFLDWLNDFVIGYAFLLEGRSLEELPENVLFSFSLCYPNIKKAKDLSWWKKQFQANSNY